MFLGSPFSKLISIALLCLSLTACESSEDRARGHYQSGLELLSEGDDQRALLEFRNALQLVPTFLDARRELARLHLKSDNVSGAFREYQLIAEQDPEDVEAPTVLARLSFLQSQWEVFERYSNRLVELAPEAAETEVIEVAARYRQAVMDEDASARRNATADAAELQKANADSEILRRILIDGYIAEGRYEDALVELEKATDAAPDDRRLYALKAQIYARLGDMTSLEQVLRAQASQFPADDQAQGQFLQFLISQGNVDEAENFLRERADIGRQDDAENAEGLFTLVQFLIQVRGPEAAMAELDRRLEDMPQSPLLRSMRASLRFDQGERSEAIAAMQDILAGDTTSISTEQLERMKITLAQMLSQTGNEVGARRLVEEILAENPNAVGALKMQARWMIEDDDTDQAITALRTALATAPEDVEAMTLMANAYQRAGNPDLMRDFLSLAVDASNKAPQPSLLYASALVDADNIGQAESTLLDSLRLQPDNIDLLTALGRLYLQTQDDARLRQVIDTLERLDTNAARRLAAALELALRTRNSGMSEAISYLEELSEEDGTLKIALVRAHLQAGEPEKALSVVDELLSERPENAALRYVRGAVLLAMGDNAAAESAFSSLVADEPESVQAWMQLIGLKRRAGASTEDIISQIDTALDQSGRAPDLLWAKATVFEEMGDVEGAIGIYEELYKTNSSSIVIANNLASLLSTARSDEASLQRAALISRRLKDTDIPAMQDTYGWILFRTGNAEEAVGYLESAAEGLPEDGQVQYHLGMAYEAVGRSEEALQQMRKAVDLIGPLGRPELIAEIRAKISEIEAAPAGE